MPSDYVQIAGSHREAPAGVPFAAAHIAGSSEPIEVSDYLKDEDPDPLLQQAPVSAKEAAASEQKAEQHAADISVERRRKYAEDLEKVTAFAKEAGLSVVYQDPARRLIRLSGPTQKMEVAFRTKLNYW